MLQEIVHLKKTTVREGLIRARLFGANLATGQVNCCCKSMYIDNFSKGSSLIPNKILR